MTKPQALALILDNPLEKAKPIPPDAADPTPYDDALKRGADLRESAYKAAGPLQIHVVKQLLLHFAPGHGAGYFQ